MDLSEVSTFELLLNNTPEIFNRGDFWSIMKSEPTVIFVPRPRLFAEGKRGRRLETN